MGMVTRVRMCLEKGAYTHACLAPVDMECNVMVWRCDVI